MGSQPFLHGFSLFIFFSGIRFSFAVDTISLATTFHDGEILSSPSQTFELGFFSPGNSKRRYIGIWYKKSPDMVVWVANRNNPTMDLHGVLTIDNGNLVLFNETKNIIWVSNTSRKVENPVAMLLDTGNLVLRDNFSTDSESYLWQSFDYPSDTLLPGMKLGWDLKTGLERHLTSWRSADDPSIGDFSYRIEINVLPQLSLYRRSKKLSRTGPWNGVFFGRTPTLPNFLFKPIVVQNENEYYYRYESFNKPIIMLLKLNQSGMVQRLIWNEWSTSGWEVVISVPSDTCESYDNCGPNSVCSFDRTPICECLKGFNPKSTKNKTWPKTCVPNFPLDCKNKDSFMKFSSFKLPDLLEVSLSRNTNLTECEAECMKNCSCRAYANSNVTGGGSGCLMWFGDLIDINKLQGEKIDGQDLYIRVSAPNVGNKKLLWLIVIVAVPVVLLHAFYVLWRRKLKEKETKERETYNDMLLFDMNVTTVTSAKTTEGKRQSAGLPFFSFSSVSGATDNFSNENKLGEGGFGPVYKGKLLNGQEVAVKRLSRQSGQGLEELKNETMLPVKLQHRNLVRILGCCIEQGEKILIYEYMPNKSLDSFLFDSKKSALLGWGTRIRIIEGVAQGLLYLHQHSRLRIIHRDLKASNILLDDNMNPKISDFGMARMFGGDESQANTKRIVGTYGYMSPEYAVHGIFSAKSDVFSFGVMLLEILSSKRSTGFHCSDSLDLLGCAWKLWKDDKAVDLIDPVLKNEVPYTMLMRYITVALLCTQENAADRPVMSEVVLMLTNELIALPSPKQPGFFYVKSLQNSVLSTNRPDARSWNEDTISEMEAR